MIGFLFLLLPGPAAADGPAKMLSLDEQVQEVKSEVLSIAAELSNLEEKLLYPSNTQLAVFVSFAEGEEVAVDSISIKVDGEIVATHIYSFKELQALAKGGVQRIHTGNVATGEHALEVSVAGKLGGGAPSERSRQFRFEKGVEPKLVEVVLNAGGSGAELISLGQP